MSGTSLFLKESFHATVKGLNIPSLSTVALLGPNTGLQGKRTCKDQCLSRSEGWTPKHACTKENATTRETYKTGEEAPMPGPSPEHQQGPKSRACHQWNKTFLKIFKIGVTRPARVGGLRFSNARRPHHNALTKAAARCDGQHFFI